MAVPVLYELNNDDQNKNMRFFFQIKEVLPLLLWTVKVGTQLCYDFDDLQILFEDYGFDAVVRAAPAALSSATLAKQRWAYEILRSDTEKCTTLAKQR